MTSEALPTFIDNQEQGLSSERVASNGHSHAHNHRMREIRHRGEGNICGLPLTVLLDAADITFSGVKKPEVESEEQ